MNGPSDRDPTSTPDESSDAGDSRWPDADKPVESAFGRWKECQESLMRNERRLALTPPRDPTSRAALDEEIRNQREERDRLMAQALDLQREHLRMDRRSTHRAPAEPLMFSVTRVSTFSGPQLLTAATGFLFRNGSRLFVVTSRHVVVDARSGHGPDRIEMLLHLDKVDLTRLQTVSLPLFVNGRSAWRQARDSGGEIDVATLELDPATLPPGAVLEAFSRRHLQSNLSDIRVGTPLSIVGFPLGFYDTLHALPVVRHAAVASAFGVRFQGEGYFLTDARTHRGTSGAPVVMRNPDSTDRLPWRLLGVHSAGLDMKTREHGVDESLGLNCAWYADILHTLTS